MERTCPECGSRLFIAGGGYECSRAECPRGPLDRATVRGERHAKRSETTREARRWDEITTAEVPEDQLAAKREESRRAPKKPRGVFSSD